MADLSATAAPIISIEGAEIPKEVSDKLFDLRVRKSTGSAAHVMMRFHDAADIQSEFGVGKGLRVAVGDDDGSETDVFSGDVVSIGIDIVGGQRDLTVEAFDKSFALGQNVVYTSHLNKSPKDVITAMARDAGLAATVDASMGTVQDHIQQAATPQAFLAELAHVYGCEWFVDGTELVVERRKLRGAKVELSGDEDLREFSVRFTGAEQAATVEVHGWDPSTATQVTGSATSDGKATSHTVDAITAARTNSNAKTALAWPVVSADATVADELAKGVNARMEAATVSGHGEVDVNAKLKPGATVAISNVVPDWDGDYYLSGVEHVFGSGQPFITRFRIGGTTPSSLVDLFGSTGARPDSSARIGTGVTVGTVTNIGDPDTLGRVKVKLPYLSDEHETGWARVVQLGAGENRGFQMMPEVDDEVLVAFAHGELQHPVVIGGLWNGVAKTKEPTSITDGQVVERSITTRTGHVLRFAEGAGEADQHITIEHGENTAKLVLGKEKLELVASGVPVEVASDDAHLLIEDGTLTLKADNIVLDAQQGIELKGTDVTVTARSAAEISGATTKLAASGTGEVSSGGITTVKGSMVKIN